MEIWQVAALVAALAGLGTLIFMIWKYFRDEHKKREDKIRELLDTAKEKLKSEREHLNEPMKHFENSLTPFTSTFEGLIRRLELDQLSLKEYWYLDLDFSPFEIHKGQMDIRWEDLPRLTADEQKQNQQFFLALVTKVFYFTQPAYGSRSQRISQELESMINYFGPLKTKDWPTYMSFLGSNVDLVDRLKGAEPPTLYQFYLSHHRLLHCLFWYSQMHLRYRRLGILIQKLESPYKDAKASVRNRIVEHIGLSKIPPELKEAIGLIN